MPRLIGYYAELDNGNYYEYVRFPITFGASTSYRVSKHNPNKIEVHHTSSVVGYVDKGWVDSGMNAKQFERMMRKQKRHYRRNTSFVQKIKHFFLNLEFVLRDILKGM